MFISPRPDISSIGQFYPDDYKPYTEPGIAHHSSTLRIVAKNSFNFLFNNREIIIPKKLTKGVLLEVGCASGRNLVKLHHQGWQTFGLEPSQSAVESLKKLDYVTTKQGTISSVDYSPGSFDLVLASMVLEHLHDPIQDLYKIHRWIKPGGYLSGSVPNSDSWEFNYFKGEWYGLHLPHHLCHFTPKTLALSLKQAGFQNIAIYQQRNINNLMVHLGRYFKNHKLPGAQTLLNFPENGPWWLRVLSHIPAAILAWCGQAGRISFTAQKPND